TYRIYDGNTLVKSVVIDQRNSPSGVAVGGGVFQCLAMVPITSGTLRVTLDDNVNGQVVADAVRVVSVAAPTSDLNWSGGGITAPATAASQTSFSIPRTYTISGSAASADFTIAYYASADAVLGNSDDILIGSETITAAADKAVGTHAGT